MPISPDANVYGIALLLALASGLLFGIVPVRQVLRTDPYQVVKAGPSGTPGRKMTLRELLLVAQIAVCAVLVTASMVAVRGLARSLHSNFGFEPRNAMLAETDLNMAGYHGEQVSIMQRQMMDAVQAVPSVQAVGIESRVPLGGGGFPPDLPRPDQRFAAIECRINRDAIQHLARIFPRGGCSPAGRQGLLLA